MTEVVFSGANRDNFFSNMYPSPLRWCGFDFATVDNFLASYRFIGVANWSALNNASHEMLQLYAQSNVASANQYWPSLMCKFLYLGVYLKCVQCKLPNVLPVLHSVNKYINVDTDPVMGIGENLEGKNLLGVIYQRVARDIHSNKRPNSIEQECLKYQSTQSTRKLAISVSSESVVLSNTHNIIKPSALKQFPWEQDKITAQTSIPQAKTSTMSISQASKFKTLLRQSRDTKERSAHSAAMRRATLERASKNQPLPLGTEVPIPPPGGLDSGASLLSGSDQPPALLSLSPPPSPPPSGLHSDVAQHLVIQPRQNRDLWNLRVH